MLVLQVDVALSPWCGPSDAHVAALTADGTLHTAHSVGGGPMEWAAIDCVASSSAVEGTRTMWRHVVPSSILQSSGCGGWFAGGECHLDLLDLRVGATRPSSSHLATFDPVNGPTVALAACQADYPSSQLIGRCSQKSVELYDQRYLARPVARWRHYQEGIGALNLLSFGASSNHFPAVHGVLHCVACTVHPAPSSAAANFGWMATPSPPSLVATSSCSDRIFAFPVAAQTAADGCATSYRPQQLHPARHQVPSAEGVGAAAVVPKWASEEGYMIVTARAHPCGLAVSGMGRGYAARWMYRLNGCGEIYASRTSVAEKDQHAGGASVRAPGSGSGRTACVHVALCKVHGVRVAPDTAHCVRDNAAASGSAATAVVQPIRAIWDTAEDSRTIVDRARAVTLACVQGLGVYPQAAAEGETEGVARGEWHKDPRTARDRLADFLRLDCAGKPNLCCYPTGSFARRWLTGFAVHTTAAQMQPLETPQTMLNQRRRRQRQRSKCRHCHVSRWAHSRWPTGKTHKLRRRRRSSRSRWCAPTLRTRECVLG